MGLFKRDYNKPGPGVPKNAPRKRGFGRFFEVLVRDFGNLVKLNLIYQACQLPGQLLFIFAFFAGQWFWAFAAGAILAGVLVGPALTAMLLLISKMLRDEPGFIWHDFKKAFRDNFRTTAIPGIIYNAIVGAQIYTVLFQFTSVSNVGFVMIALFFLSVLLFWMTSRYFFLQAGYLELGMGALLKNSLLLALGNAPRSLAATVITLGAGILQLLTLASLPVTLIFGYSLPALASLMFIWPPVNKTFKIEETLKTRQEAEADDLPKNELE